MRRFVLFAMVALLSHSMVAREGMWIPMLLEKFNIQEMQSMGFKLTAEDIYSINQASMKDAVMVFGGGCTGELISGKGLLITNHHCGYSAIQRHSSVEHDYLTDGFWAMSLQEELPNPNLKVYFLKRMEDVTEQVLEGVCDTMSVKERESIITANIAEIKKQAVEGTHYTAHVEPFFYGNQYFLFVNEAFTDVRLVGAPPSAIGKFGGDTDNWMWPRHTGDFSLFRIYANKENQPADYSPDNVPYQSPVHFPISLKGVEEGDFTLVFGYPGRTSQYVPSWHIDMLGNHVYPKLVDLRTAKLKVMNRYMEEDRAVRIKYAAKNASISNSWKRWIGEIKGLDKLDVIDKKRNYEAGFNQWVNESDHRRERYGNLLKQYEGIYKDYTQYSLVRNYLMEYIGRTGLESVGLAGTFERLAVMVQKENPDEEAILKEKERLRDVIAKHFKDYYLPVDKEITQVALTLLKAEIAPEFLPDVFARIDSLYKGSVIAYVDHLFGNTLFASEEKARLFLKEFSHNQTQKLKDDPAYQLFGSLGTLDSLNHVYMAAMMAYEPERVFYPDANFTLRVAYGNVKGYEGADGICYKHFTTLEGIIQKDNPEVYDYRVPERLKELYLTRDYGRYEVNGTVPVCFIADNHTTGGNSGSPVINANGELIGINFDRAWDGVMSDLMFNPGQSRNISLDVRYVLFLIDKFAGAGYLLDEMTLVE